MDFNGQGNINGGQDPFAHLIPDRAEMECEELFAQADRLLTEGAVMDAVDKLSQIIKRNPRFGKAYNHLGWVFEMKYKNMPRAEQYYRAAIEHAPNYTAPYLNYAYFLSNQGRLDELRAHLDRMAKLPGIAKDTLANEYAMMHEMTGDLHQAIKHYQDAAIVTLDGAKLDKYRDGIDRCRRKLELLNLSGSF